MTGTRRRFLSLVCGAAATVSAQAPNHPVRLVRSASPEDLEMPLAGFLERVTPVDLFFVRSHTLVPRIDPAAWALEVGGHVDRGLKLSLAELRNWPATELVGVLECAGNGRSFYNPPVAGLQWGHGAASNGRWRGVRLGELLKRAGMRDGAVEVAFDGADSPLGTMADFRRSIPIKKALHPDTLLAYDLNGEPLPEEHGFPLRAVVPGWAGDSWVKWITGIQVLDKDLDGFWMKSAYLHPGHAVPPGSTVPANAMAPVTSLRVKSVIASPADGSEVAIGKPLEIRGAAWGGDGGPVTGVDVSLDNGRTWKAARLVDSRTPYGWRRWEFPWTPQEERFYTVLARARDARGDSQPLVAEWNPSGYLWNVAARVDLNAQQAITAPGPLSASQEQLVSPPALRTACLACHGEDVIRQQRLTRAQWDREITKMTNWGARLSPEDRVTILDYLAKYLAPSGL